MTFPWPKHENRCSFVDFVNEQNNVGTNKLIFFKLLADEKCVVMLSFTCSGKFHP